MLLQLCAVAVLLGSIQAFTHEEANEYMDKVLNGRFPEEANYSRLDPYKMEDIEVPVNVTSPVRVDRAFLSKGKLINLSKVRRSDDCRVPFYQSANITFTCFLLFDKLQVNYSGNVSYENEGLTFYPKMYIESAKVTVQVTSNHEDDIPNLKLLFINHIGTLTINSEMGSIEKHAIIHTILGQFIGQALEKKTIQTLHRVIGGKFKDALAYSIYKTPVGFGK